MFKSLKAILFLFVFLQTIASVNAQAVIKKASTDAAIENAILVDVNAYRKKYHLAPLKMDAHISQQAKNHSRNMAKHQVPFGHKNFFKRVDIIRKEVKNAGAAAENVAYNYKDAHDVVKNWMLSPGHKKNILGNYNLTGIGIVRDARGKIHFTQMFVKTGAPKTVSRRSVARTTPFPHFSLGSIFKRSTS